MLQSKGVVIKKMDKILMDKSKNSEIILTICTGLVVLFLVFGAKWIIYMAAIIGVLSLVSGWMKDKIAWSWIKLSEVLGYISSRVILTIVFYCILFPVAMISRLQKGDFLQLRRKKEGESYYHDRNHQYCSEDLEKMW